MNCFTVFRLYATSCKNILSPSLGLIVQGRTLVLEAACSYEVLVRSYKTWHNCPEDLNIKSVSPFLEGLFCARRALNEFGILTLQNLQFPEA
jgi:hypothetical protein